MKKIWALLLAVLLLVSVLCVGAIPANAAITATFVDEIVDGFTHPEIIEYTAEGTTEIGTQGHRLSYEYNGELGTTLMLKQDNDRNPAHTEHIVYKMAKNIAGFELSVMCCAGLGDPLEDITIYISKSGAADSWVQVKTQATKYVYDTDIYLGWHQAYWFNSKLMNAQKIPTGYKYMKVQFNPCTDVGDVPWNVAVDTVTVYMGSNVDAPTIAEEDTFIPWSEINDQEESTTTPSDSTTEPTTEPTTEATTESTTEATVESTTASTAPSAEPTVPTTQPSVPEDNGPMFGDVNNDGKVNIRDLGLMQQYINGWEVTIDLELADVFVDGKINARDLGRLQQYINGWDVILGGGTKPTEPTTPPAEPTTPSEPEPTTPPTEPTTPPTQPTEPPAPAVDMPSAGYDLDGKGRIQVTSSEIQDNKAYFVIANVSRDNGREWIIPEYSVAYYACYDANGKKLSSGTLTLGALEYGDSIQCSVTMPAGTVRIAFTGHNLEYWTPWA